MARFERLLVVLAFAGACSDAHGGQTHTAGAGGQAGRAGGDSRSGTGGDSRSGTGGDSRSGTGGDSRSGTGGDSSGGHRAAAGSAGNPWGDSPGTPHYYYCIGAYGLAGGGRARANCEGDCAYELEIHTNVASDGAHCLPIIVSLAILNTDGTLRKVDGELPLQAWGRIGEIAEEIKAAQVTWTTGCTNCPRDRDRSWIVRHRLVGFPDELHYVGAAPAPLGAADALVQALIDELSTCTQPGAQLRLLSSCEPETDRCSFEFEDEASGDRARCVVFGNSGPCNDATSCLCAEGLLPGTSETGPGDVQECAKKWVDPTSPMTFGDLCGPQDKGSGGNLGRALSIFAERIGRKAYVAETCQQIPIMP